MSTRLTRFQGKSREQIAAIVAKLSRDEIAGIIKQLLELEPHLTPEEIASLRKLPRRTIVAAMKDGRIASHAPAETKLRAPLSAVIAWDESTALRKG